MKSVEMRDVIGKLLILLEAKKCFLLVNARRFWAR